MVLRAQRKPASRLWGEDPTRVSGLGLPRLQGIDQAGRRVGH